MLQNNNDSQDEIDNWSYRMFNTLIDRYGKYIRKNNIDMDYEPNFDIIMTHISRYYNFIKEYDGKYDNSTYIYFKAVYHFCSNEERDNKNDTLRKLFKLNEHINNSYLYWLIGLHYYHNHNNLSLMRKYYLIAIKLNNPLAMLYLGYYYNCNNINYDLMKNYYLMAIELGYVPAMYALGDYFYNTQNNSLTEKYYLMTIEQSNNTHLEAFISLRLHFTRMGKDRDYIWKFIYLPRILALILISMRRIRNAQKNNAKQPLFFLPQELYIKIFDDYIVKESIIQL